MISLSSQRSSLIKKFGFQAVKKKIVEAYISHNVFELTKLNLEFENCLNLANASGFVILNRYN